MDAIDINFFDKYSFIDCRILKLELSLEKKILSIELNGADLVNSEYLSKTKLLIENWQQLDVMERENDRKLPIDPKKYLKSIMEFHYDSDELRLVDLGYNCWIDWIFLKPKVTIYGDYQE